MANKTISELETKTPTGSMYVPIEDSTSTGKATIADVIGAASPVMMVQGLITNGGDTITLNKTWAEIRTALTSGKFVFIITAESAVTGTLDELGVYFISGLWIDTENGSHYVETTSDMNNSLTFTAPSSSGTLVSIPNSGPIA